MGGNDRCSISGCDHRRGRASCKFYSYPSDKIARSQWLCLSGRLGFTAKDILTTTKVCSCHFISGQPNRYDSNHVDYLPSLNLPKSVIATEVRRNKRPHGSKAATPCISQELDRDKKKQRPSTESQKDTDNASESLQQEVNGETALAVTSTTLSTSVNSNSGFVNSDSTVVNSNSGQMNAKTDSVSSNNDSVKIPLSVPGIPYPHDMTLKQSEGKSDESTNQEAAVKQETNCMYSSASLSTSVNSNSSLINSDRDLMNANSSLVNSSISFPLSVSGILCPKEMHFTSAAGKWSENTQHEAFKEETVCMYSSVCLSTCVNSNSGSVKVMNSNGGLVNSDISQQMDCEIPFVQDVSQKQILGKEIDSLQQEASKETDCDYSSTRSFSNVSQCVQFPLSVYGNPCLQNMKETRDEGKENKSLKQEANEVTGRFYSSASLFTSVNSNSAVVNSSSGSSLMSTSGLVNTSMLRSLSVPEHQKQNADKERESLKEKIKKWLEFSRKKTGGKDNDTHVELENENSEKAKGDVRPYAHCSICSKRVLEVTLKRHVLLHMKPQFQCEVCKKRFRNPGYLAGHLRIHAGALPYKCSFCDKRFSSSRARDDHELSHDCEKPYKCSLCGCRFNKNWGLEVHMAIHTAKRRFRCTECGKEFLRRNNLEMHLRIHEIQKQVTCHICGERFVNRHLLKKHLWQHENPGKVALWAHSSEDKDGHNDAYTCIMCDKLFRNSFSFQKHRWTHDCVPEADEIIENSFECVRCGEKSFTFEDLKKHWLKHVHEKKESSSKGQQEQSYFIFGNSFVCVYCGKELLTQQALKTHINRRHAFENVIGNKEEHCGSSDSQTDLRESLFSGGRGEEKGKEEEEEETERQFLEVAEEQPSSELPQKYEMDDLECTICEKQFSGLTELKLHTLTHYDNARCYTCQVCGEVLLDILQFEKHKLEHSASSDSKDIRKVVKSKLKCKLLSKQF